MNVKNEHILGLGLARVRVRHKGYGYTLELGFTDYG